MNDGHRVTALLNLAADVPERIQPPVGPLLQRARRARRNRIAAVSGLTAAVMIGAAVGLPVLASSPGPGVSSPLGPGSRGLGPTGGGGVTAAALSRYHWVTLARSPVGRVSSEVIAWTGRELLEFSGPATPPKPGAAYDPAAGRWRRLASPPASVGTSGATAAWTGRQLFMTNGGSRPGSRRIVAGLYDLAANRWSTTMLPVALAGLAPLCPNCQTLGSTAATQLTAVWDGRDIVVAGRLDGRLRVAGYDPATGRWQMISPGLPRRHPAEELAMVAVGSRVIVWSLWSRAATSTSIAFGVDVLVRDQLGSWTNATGNWPQSRTVPEPVAAGGQILVPNSQFWCGFCPGPSVVTPVYLASAETLRGGYLPRGPLDPDAPAVFWTGRAALAVTLDGVGQYGRKPGPVAAFGPLPAAPRPVTGRWIRLATPPAIVFAAVWTGRELLGLGPAGTLLAFRR